MIELLFGAQKANEVKQKYKFTGIASTSDRLQAEPSPGTRSAEMSTRFKDAIEVNLVQLNGLVHQISKGSYCLREGEFNKVFKYAGIVVTSQDLDVLSFAFTKLKNAQTL